MLALSFYEVSYGAFAELPIAVAASVAQKNSLFAGAYVGLLSFESFSSIAYGGKTQHNRVWWVEQALVFNQRLATLTLLESSSPPEKRPEAIGPRFALTREVLQGLLAAAAKSSPSFVGLPISLRAQGSEAEYLAQCQQAMEFIRGGRFYQLNLLRYFWADCAYERSALLARLLRRGGPYSSWFELPDLALLSLSPERFVSFRPHGQKIIAKTYPVKGTRARREDGEQDRLARLDLEHSVKDHAELHMIVDLLRNDLNTVSELGSVRVEKEAQLVSFPSVHHLVAEISSCLRRDLRIGDLLRGLCPGGSISGCPKREVLKGISEFEQRPRGYFMGHSFYFDEGGNFDSAVLIRTLVGEGDGSGGYGLEYAAGSGITIGSDPQQELQEIWDKCQVVLSELC